MANPLYNTLSHLAAKRDATTVMPLFQAGYNAISSKSITTAGLVIKTGGSPLVKTGATAYLGSCNGVIVRVNASTDLPALVGTVLTTTHNVFVFSIDGTGTTYVQMGTAGTTIAGMKFPAVIPKRAYLGFVYINPTGTGSFIGGTTALDDATVVPNAVYQNQLSAYDQTATI